MSIAIGKDITAADMATLAALANAKLAPGTPYAFGASSYDWLTQLNRIRTDLYAKIFTDNTSPIYKSPDALVSDPQCVGVNPCPQVRSNGKLYLQDATPAGAVPFPLFKEISFLYAVTDADFTFGNLDINFDIPYLDLSTTDVKLFWGYGFVDQTAGTWDWNINSGITDTGSAPNRTFSFTINWTTPVDATLWVKIKIPLTGGGYDETHSIVQKVAAGSGTINWTATGDYSGFPIFTAIEFFWPGDTVTADATVIHPDSAAKQISLTDIDWAIFGGFAFTVTGRSTTNSAPAPFVTLNLPSLRGMWLARTLPTPALNTFLDSDLPLYVRRIVSSRLSTDDRVRLVGNSADTSYLDIPGDGLANNPRSGLRQPSPTLPRRTLGFLFATPALANNANYNLAFLFPDDITLQVYGGPGNTGADPLMVLDHTLPIYVSLKPNIDPTNPATYGFTITSNQLTFANMRAHYDGSTDALTADGRKLYVLIHNNSGSDIAILTVIWEDYEAFIIRPAEPGIFTQPAVWPVMRDTDDYPWYQFLDPWRSLNQIGPVTLANGAHYNDIVQFLALINVKDFKYSVAPALPVYVSLVGPPNTASPGPDVLIKSGGTVTLADLQAQYGNALDSALVYFTTLNNSGSSKNVTLSARFLKQDAQGRFQSLPVFFPGLGFELDPVLQANGVCEAFPTTLFDATPFIAERGMPPLIPQRGYVIYSVLVRRQSKLTVAATAKNPSIYLPPTADADLQALDVNLGFFSGLTHTSFEAINKGAFESLTTITIPHGELEARVDVFWPVLYGTMLVYQIDLPPLYVVGSPTGLVVIGNIDLNHRPVVHNPDGSISTVRSITIEADGLQILIPTVNPGGFIMTNDDAIAYFISTGQHLGKFDTDQNAETYSITLHNQQSDLYENPIVSVEPLVNFQPIFHGKQYGQAFYPERGNTDPSAAYLVPACRYRNYFDKFTIEWPGDVHAAWYTQFPMAAVVIDDLIAALNLL